VFSLSLALRQVSLLKKMSCVLIGELGTVRHRVVQRKHK
jgi:hypothetical protein